MSPHQAADAILDKLRIRDAADLRDLDTIAWALGALVCRDSLSGTEARLSYKGGRAVITVDSGIRNPQRVRFAVAHELGHLDMHADSNSLSICTSSEIDETEKPKAKLGKIESEANSFAASLLMPARLVAPKCRGESPSFELIENLSQEFDTSLTSTAIRYMHFCPEPCAIVYSENGVIRWFRGSDDFRRQKFFVMPREPVDEFTLAGDFFKSGKSCSNQEKVEAGSWLTPGRHAEDAVIIEQTRTMPTFNATLTLLWVHQDILQGEFY